MNISRAICRTVFCRSNGTKAFVCVRASDAVAARGMRDVRMGRRSLDDACNQPRRQ